MDDVDLRRGRAARNQSLFREVNERIAELSERYADALQPNMYLCECLNTECTETVELAHDEYERVRERGSHFFVLPGHQNLAVEHVVETTEHYLIVEKIGKAGEVAESANPRNTGAAE